MKTSLKSLAVAALATFAAIAAPTVVQAQDHPQFDRTHIVKVGGAFYGDDGYVYHQPRQRHHRNGFSLEFQFGQPQVFYQPSHPRPIYQPRPRQVIQLTRAHVNWCYSRYRTYDHHSNSFVIRHGQRAYCVSPFSY